MSREIYNELLTDIKNSLNNLDFTNYEIANALGITNNYLSNILNGSKEINIDLILKISRLLNVESKVFASKYIDYLITKSLNNDDVKVNSLNEYKDFKNELPSLKEFEKLNVLTGSIEDKLAKTKRIFNVADYKEFKHKLLNSPKRLGYFKKSDKVNVDFDNLYAWENLCRYKASEIIVEEYRGISDELIRNLKKIIYKNENLIDSIQNELSKNGIIFFVQEKLSKCPVDGYSFKLKESPVIVVTLRMKRLDNFAFSLFHEIGHVKLHSNMLDLGFIDIFGEKNENEIENEANDFAAEYLYGRELNKKIFDLEFINDEILNELENDFKINAGIILGRYKYIHNRYRIKSEVDNVIN